MCPSYTPLGSSPPIHYISPSVMDFDYSQLLYGFNRGGHSDNKEFWEDLNAVLIPMDIVQS